MPQKANVEKCWLGRDGKPHWAPGVGPGSELLGCRRGSNGKVHHKQVVPQKANVENLTPNLSLSTRLHPELEKMLGNRRLKVCYNYSQNYISSPIKSVLFKHLKYLENK